MIILIFWLDVNRSTFDEGLPGSGYGVGGTSGSGWYCCQRYQQESCAIAKMTARCALY